MMLTQEEKNYLSTTEPLYYLQPHELNMLTEYSQVVTFSPGEKVIQQGQTSEGMYILINGNAIIFTEIFKSYGKQRAVKFDQTDINRNELKTAKFFNKFTDEEFNILLQQMHVLQAPKNTPLIKLNDQNSSFYFIYRGAIQANI